MTLEEIVNEHISVHATKYKNPIITYLNDKYCIWLDPEVSWLCRSKNDKLQGCIWYLRDDEEFCLFNAEEIPPDILNIYNIYCKSL